MVESRQEAQQGNRLRAEASPAIPVPIPIRMIPTFSMLE